MRWFYAPNTKTNDPLYSAFLARQRRRSFSAAALKVGARASLPDLSALSLRACAVGVHPKRYFDSVLSWCSMKA